MSDKKSLALAASWGLAVAIGWGASSYANEGGELPQAVKDAVKRAFPNATVLETEDEQLGVRAYEVELRDGEARIDMTIAADGTVIEVERVVAAGDLPAAVSQTLTREAAGATVVKIERAELMAQARLVALSAPEVSYEAEVTKDGKTRELTIGANGAVLDDEDEDDGDEDEDEDEDEDD